MTQKKKWLKKYMKLEHLKDTLVNHRLFLGNPEVWEDKNDAALMAIYQKKKGLNNLRATCLTSGLDRYHFWEVFGGKREGVCLWFCKEVFEADFEQEKVDARKVEYLNISELRDKQVDDLPFSKRK